MFKHTFFSLVIVFLFGSTLLAQQKAFVYSSAAGLPWSQTSYLTCMDNVFGAGNWDQLTFEAVDPNVLFSGAYDFIYLEGSNLGDIPLSTFTTANQALMEAWVLGGGDLYVNSAGNNDGTLVNLGFGGVVIHTLDFAAGISDDAVAVAGIEGSCALVDGPPGNYNGVTFTGGNFSHGFVTGPITPILESTIDNTQIVLGTLEYGTGTLMASSITPPVWHTYTNPKGFIENLLTNSGACGLPVTPPAIANDDADGDGTPDIADPCSCSDPLNPVGVTGPSGGEVFHEVITITSDPGETWEMLGTSTGVLDATGAAATFPIAVPEVSPGVYVLEIYHEINVGYTGNFSNGTPADDQTISNACTVSCSSVPTLSEWGLIIFGLLMLNLAVVYVLRRREQVQVIPTVS